MTAPTQTEALYVVIRLLVVIFRDMQKTAHTNPEVTRAVVWADKALGGFHKLGEEMGMLQREQRDLRRAYEMGMAAAGIRGAVLNVLDYEIAQGQVLTPGSACWIADMVYTAISSHIHDMMTAQIISSRPEDPLPDACLAISSEE